MAATCQLYFFYISSDLTISEDRKKISFSVAESIPRHNGLKTKLSVTAFDEAAQKVTRLKARKGSSVDLICEMVPYTVGGELRIGYRLIDINYSVIPTMQKPESPTKETKEAKMTAADILANCPFD